MELLTERYADKITGVISCYDRVVITIHTVKPGNIVTFYGRTSRWHPASEIYCHEKEHLQSKTAERPAKVEQSSLFRIYLYH